MNIEIGNLRSKLNTDNPELLDALYKLFSFKVPGSEYSTAYRARQWDGKQHYISRSGVFKSGLLPRILNTLKKIDCFPELQYQEDRTIIVQKDWSIPNFTYYSFQEQLIETALKNTRGIIKAPTGAGKTLIMAGLIKALSGHKMVLLFNAKQLLTQTYDFLTETCGMDNIGLCFGEGYIYGDIMLCTVQSVEKILETHLEETEVLMVDECHEFANGKTTLAAIQSFPKATYRYGFTATPPSDNIPLHNLEGALGEITQAVSTSGLVEEGKLTKPIIYLVDRQYTASGLDDDKAYLEVYEDYIITNNERNDKIRKIVNGIRRENKQSRILILTKSLDHGRTLEELCGGHIEFLEGANSVGERYNAISRFRGCNESSVLIGTKILQTGINIEEITHFINARGMKSEIATLQALGRALRRHDSKDRVYVYDFLDKEKYLKEHSNARKKYYKREGHEVEKIEIK